MEKEKTTKSKRSFLPWVFIILAVVGIYIGGVVLRSGAVELGDGPLGSSSETVELTGELLGSNDDGTQKYKITLNYTNFSPQREFKALVKIVNITTQETVDSFDIYFDSEKGTGSASKKVNLADIDPNSVMLQATVRDTLGTDINIEVEGTIEVGSDSTSKVPVTFSSVTQREDEDTSHKFWTIRTDYECLQEGVNYKVIYEIQDVDGNLLGYPVYDNIDSSSTQGIVTRELDMSIYDQDVKDLYAKVYLLKEGGGALSDTVSVIRPISKYQNISPSTELEVLRQQDEVSVSLVYSHLDRNTDYTYQVGYFRQGELDDSVELNFNSGSGEGSLHTVLPIVSSDQIGVFLYGPDGKELVSASIKEEGEFALNNNTSLSETIKISNVQFVNQNFLVSIIYNNCSPSRLYTLSLQYYDESKKSYIDWVIKDTKFENTRGTLSLLAPLSSGSYGQNIKYHVSLHDRSGNLLVGVEEGCECSYDKQEYAVGPGLLKTTLAFPSGISEGYAVLDNGDIIENISSSTDWSFLKEHKSATLYIRVDEQEFCVGNIKWYEPIFYIRDSQQEGGLQARVAQQILGILSYSNVIPNVEYKVNFTLVDTESEVLVDKKAVSQSATFIPDSFSGECRVEFSFDGSFLENQEVSLSAEVLIGSNIIRVDDKYLSWFKINPLSADEPTPVATVVSTPNVTLITDDNTQVFKEYQVDWGYIFVAGLISIIILYLLYRRRKK